MDVLGQGEVGPGLGVALRPLLAELGGEVAGVEVEEERGGEGDQRHHLAPALRAVAEHRREPPHERLHSTHGPPARRRRLLLDGNMVQLHRCTCCLHCAGSPGRETWSQLPVAAGRHSHYRGSYRSALKINPPPRFDCMLRNYLFIYFICSFAVTCTAKVRS